MSAREQSIQFMTSCGVSRGIADEALTFYHGDAERALNMIFSGVFKPRAGTSTQTQDANTGTGTGDSGSQGSTGQGSNDDANSNASGGNGGSGNTGGAAGTNDTGGMTRSRSQSQIEMDKAIAASLAERKARDQSPLQLQRSDPTLPLGLRNLGNTCFVNCLLQVYFHLPMFRKAVLSGVVKRRGAKKHKRERKPGEPPTPTVTPDVLMGEDGAPPGSSIFGDGDAAGGGAAESGGESGEGDGGGARGGAGGGSDDSSEHFDGLLKDLRRLFAYLVLSDKKYCDPTDVLNDMSKCRIIQAIGFQEDISEVNDLFLEALEKTPLKPFLLSTFQGKTVTNYRYNRSDVDQSMAGSIDRPDSFSNMHATVLSEDSKTDFYEALDSETSTEVVSFTTDENFKTNAEKVTLIQRFPPCFTLQLRRIRFDQDSMQLRKINAPFWFDKEVYFERYLWSNRDEIMRRRRAIADQRARIAHLESELEGLSHSGKDGHVVLGETLALLEKLGREEAAAPLRRVFDRLKVKIEGLYTEVAATQKSISLSFDDMTGEPYVLHAVVVHEGRTVDMGHYNVYILVGGRRWYKFNDTNVEPLEDESFIQKVRDHPDKSVYLLFYVRKEAVVVQQMPPEEVPEEEGEGEAALVAADWVPADLREEVEADNLQFVVEVDDYLEAEQRAITQERATFKDVFAKRWTAMEAKERKLNDPKTPIHSPPIDERITSYSFFLWLLGEEEREAARYQLALDVYKDVVKHRDVNPRDELVALVEIEKPPPEKLQELEGLRRLFLTVTHYFIKGVKFMSFYSAQDFRPLSPIEAFRVALAYDNLIPEQYPRVKQRELITKYFAVTLNVFLTHGNQMIRNNNIKCIEFFQSLVDKIPILTPSPKYCLYLKHYTVDEFFDNLVTIRSYRHRFQREEERVLLNQWILRFQQMNSPDEVPRVFEKPSEITQSFGVQEYLGLTDATLARELQAKMKTVNNKFWTPLNRFKNAGIRDKFGFPAKPKDYRKWTGFFKASNLSTTTRRFFG